MRAVLESFYISGAKSGALTRVEDETGLHSHICFLEPDGGLFDTESNIRYDGDPTQWIRYDYSERHAGSRYDLVRPHGLPDPTIPSYATYLLVRELARTGRERLSFYSLEEGGPSEPPVLTELRRSGEVIEEVRDGLVGNFHLVDGGEIVTSDWQGAESHRVADTETLLSGLHRDVSEPVRRFLSRFS